MELITDDNNKSKKAKGTRKGVIQRKLKLEDYKKCLQAPQLENKIWYPEKSKIDLKSLIENHKGFIKTSKWY